MRKLVLIVLLILPAVTCYAAKKQWYSVYNECFNCDVNGAYANEKTHRFWISNPTFASDTDCIKQLWYKTVGNMGATVMYGHDTADESANNLESGLAPYINADRKAVVKRVHIPEHACN